MQARSVEVSARFLDETREFSVTAYALDSDNLIIRDSDFFNIDGQSTISRGVEFSVSQTLSEHWTVRAIGSIADHQYSNDLLVDDININGKQVDTAPKVFGSAFVDWQASQRLRTSLEIQHIGSYYLDPTNEHEYPGHTLLNARVGYQLGEQWALSLRALNLANRRFAERADFTSFTDERYFPGEPRSVFAEIRRTF